MPKANLCEIVILLDRSGSMRSIQKDMEGGLNTFVEEQKKTPGDCNVTFVQFDSEGIDTVFVSKPLAEVPPIKFEPRGWTPLLDAMGKTILDVGIRFAARTEEERPERVLFLVITDGEENRSREFNRDQVRKMVEEQTTNWKWQFSFLGANIDSFATAGALGVKADATANYDPSPIGVASMLGDVSRSSSNYRSGSSYQLPATPPAPSAPTTP